MQNSNQSERSDSEKPGAIQGKASDTEVTPSEKKQVYRPEDSLEDRSFPSESSEKKTQDLTPDRLYANIDAAAQNCRKIYFLYIGLLIYSLLTVITTPDQHLILGRNVKLPIVNTTVPVDFFFMLTPLLAIGLFVYIQLNLIKIYNLIVYALDECREAPNCSKKKENKCNISNICKRQQNRMYPWIFIFSRFPEKGIVATIQSLFVKVSLWWLLPIVLVLFALFVIKKHEPFSSYSLLILFLLGTGIVSYFWHKADPSKIIGRLSLTSIVIPFSIFLFMLIPRANEGNLWPKSKAPDGLASYFIRRLEPMVLVNLSNQKLIEEPEVHEKHNPPYWINLEGVHLEGADLSSTVLIKANLKNSNLMHANLFGAKLDKADLDKADLSSATLTIASLKGASLYMAQLPKADLLKADLENANLSRANLEGTDLRKAKFKEATLARANLKKADLRDANFLDAKLRGANLFNARLSGANFQGADLKKILFTNLEQFANVETLFQAELDSALKIKLKSKYPYLFKKPVQ